MAEIEETDEVKSEVSAESLSFLFEETPLSVPAAAGI